MCPVYLHFCVCGRPGGRLCFVAAYVCKCIKHTEQRGPEAKKQKRCALIVCDFVEELKGILSPVPGRPRESETKTRSKGVGRREQRKEGDKILITVLCFVFTQTCTS